MIYKLNLIIILFVTTLLLSFAPLQKQQRHLLKY
jgi:hypothetical protein